MSSLPVAAQPASHDRLVTPSQILRVLATPSQPCRNLRGCDRLWASVASRSAGIIWLSVAGALTGFAANSLLTRAAVGRHFIDPVSFSEIRLASGALTLLALQRLSGRSSAGGGRTLDRLIGAAALGVYAFAFAFAYARIDAGTGALVLFGGVQLTMLTWSVVSGERSGALEWIGLATAATGLVVLTHPGTTAPDHRGAALMASAGAAWGIYTLRGRGAGDPLARTATSFLWAAIAGALSWHCWPAV